jgi:hypothetical protein
MTITTTGRGCVSAQLATGLHDVPRRVTHAKATMCLRYDWTQPWRFYRCSSSACFQMATIHPGRHADGLGKRAVQRALPPNSNPHPRRDDQVSSIAFLFSFVFSLPHTPYRCSTIAGHLAQHDNDCLYWRDDLNQTTTYSSALSSSIVL